MKKSTLRSGGVSLAVVAVLGGAVACQGDDGGKPKGKASKTAPEHSPLQALTIAAKKTDAAKSAKVKMNVSAPGQAGGNMAMSGVVGWDPFAMDLTMDGSMLAQAGPDAPQQVRMVWLDSAMYFDMGEKAAAETDGKRWMKLDLEAMAKKSGDEAMMKQMTAGLDQMNQDPARQLALLLDSPNLKHVGSKSIDGQQAEGYKGKLTVEEMLKANKSAEILSEQERKQLLDGMKKSGITAYDTEVWVDEDDYPVLMRVAINSPEGQIKVAAHYSDYGAKADVKAPPAGETFDLFAMLKKMERTSAP